LDYAANVRQGNLPEARLLWFSRVPMAVLAAITGWLLYLLAESSAGRLAGYSLLALYSGSAYLLTQLRRAMSEAPLLFFTTLACVAAWRALKNWQEASQKESVTFKNLQRPLAWFLVAGSCCGLAGASKINGLFAAGGVCLLVVLAVFLNPGKIPAGLRWTFAIRGTILTLLVAMVIFIAANPFLYSDPFNRTVRMFKFRIQEMSLQVAGFPENVIHGPAERMELVPRRVLEHYASLNFDGALWLNLALAGLGLVVLIKRRGDVPAGLAWLIVPAPLVVGALVTPLDWDRYYLFPVVYTTFFMAVGLGWAGHWLWGKTIRMRSRFPKPPS
jgi:4-amino-4-deoxy-L-arabinose transferase-like glycosyltransferase